MSNMTLFFVVLGACTAVSRFFRLIERIDT